MRPIFRLPRLVVLIRHLLSITPDNHSDQHILPQLIEIFETVLREANARVDRMKGTVSAWRYRESLTFKSDEERFLLEIDNPRRTIVHSSVLICAPEVKYNPAGWCEVLCLLFDNCCEFLLTQLQPLVDDLVCVPSSVILTKPKEHSGGVIKHHVYRQVSGWRVAKYLSH
jgi:hypothetical protein